MIYSDFQGKKLSLLGFGTMRFPVLEDGSIDGKQVEEMTEYAISHGVNYFDTALPYHNGESERVIGRALRKYPRESYYLADKFPGHQVMDNFDPAPIFERQLAKCGVDYFDFYLLHNVYENSVDTYEDPKWGIMEYFREQKRLGRIRHLGFSTHGSTQFIREFLDRHGEDMEFCQIQLNYLDWTLQDAKGKYEFLTERGIPVWVMEPVRGGKLAKLSDENEEKLKTLRPKETIPAWGFRFLQGLPNVKMILSGMSNLEQMRDNVKTFSESRPLTDRESERILEIAEGMKDSIPCTACRYCCEGCPKGLDIPKLIGIFNEVRFMPTTISAMRVEFLPEDKKPSACISCGKCKKICPQNIDIPQAMQDLTKALEKIPSWTEVCRQREAARRKLENKQLG